MTDTADLPPLKNYDYYSDGIVYDGSVISICATSTYTGWKFLYINDSGELPVSFDD